jgi:ribosomal protein S18 acetylase RimI-like enzyme
VKHFVNNPVYGGLTSGDRHLGFGTEKARFFDERVSPFAGIEEGYARGFEELYELLPEGRVILYARAGDLKEPAGWQLLQGIKGLQLVFEGGRDAGQDSFSPLPLGEEHVGQMMELAALTKPGPFGPRTIDFGSYFGIFQKEKLAAMAGQRLHVQDFTEISAVCTHPGCLGRGYASALVRQQAELILEQGKTPFLHVREDNRRAIEMYERIGFVISGEMNFYVLKRQGSSGSTGTA